MPPEVVIAELTAAGFDLAHRIDHWRFFGTRSYALVFDRPAATTDR